MLTYTTYPDYPTTTSPTITCPSSGTVAWWWVYTWPPMSPSEPAWLSVSCEKCGNTDIATDWHKGTWYDHEKPHCSYDQRTAEGPEGEHLHRTCRVCHFHWRQCLRPW